MSGARKSRNRVSAVYDDRGEQVSMRHSGCFQEAIFYMSDDLLPEYEIFIIIIRPIHVGLINSDGIRGGSGGSLEVQVEPPPLFISQ